eukprot:TRINITY_DN100_c0_g1_i4.p1 TRINITY_DN100_c0_g1~~TRINITY_DN100_c0_g1_i4.p1  ORF type:complete len:104 (-),score=22.38 TRINITY_DN100_c0_g1_i4:181-492(-)
MCIRDSRKMASSVVGRAMSTVAQRSSGGALAPFRPKIAVYRHLSPFEVNPITPFSKWLKTYKAKAIENYHWALLPAYFFGVKITGDTIYEQYAWEHALHPEEE